MSIISQTIASWQFDNGCFPGDFVDDTPPQRRTGGVRDPEPCPASQELYSDSCPLWPGRDPLGEFEGSSLRRLFISTHGSVLRVDNIMDYSAFSCPDKFTPGQVQRMTDAWYLYRA